MHQAIADKEEELAELCRRYGVARLKMFRSAAHLDPPTSRADFLVEFRHGSGRASLRRLFDFAEALHRALGRPSIWSLHPDLGICWLTSTARPRISCASLKV